MKSKKIGYKAFNKDSDSNLYCREKFYNIGEIAEVTGELELCKNGIHFCNNLADINKFYSLKNDVVCEIEVLGDVIDDNNKSCTNKIKVIKILSHDEILKLANSGDYNSGYGNSGNGNTGDRNTGDCNSGDCNSGGRNTGDRNTGYGNSGDRNTGDRNTGDYNSGYGNSGDRNTGDRNTGDRNTGDYNSGYGNTGSRNTGYRNTGYGNSGNSNTGDYNSGNGNTGFFNSIDTNIYIFNTLSQYTYKDFVNSIYYKALQSSPFILCEWIEYPEDEKKETEGGYLKVYTYKEACVAWWKKLTDGNREIIKQMPNFDAKIFEEITGIRI